MKFDNQLRYAAQILETYQGEIPLHVWLKDYFRLNKQMGSRDRKLLSTLVYGFYRLGHAITALPVQARLLSGLFLCHNAPHELLQHFKPEWNEKAGLPLEARIAFFQTQPEGAGFRVTNIFPWKDELSEGIDHEAFCLSFLRQPDLFLRIRPGHEQTVLGKLGLGTQPPPAPAPVAAQPASPLQPLSGSSAAPAPQTAAAFIPPFTVRLPNGFKVEDHFTPDHEVVVQDYSSQQIAGFLQPAIGNTSMAAAQSAPAASQPERNNAPQFFWDACAASGGKSILAHDLYPKMEIFVSDIRDSIIHNLRSRFSRAGIKKYHAFIADLTRALPPAAAMGADLILVDVPCTGSGTWGRTPEDLWFFDPQRIDRYAEIQKAIIDRLAPHLLRGSRLVYSTCSVFKKENEEMAARIRDIHGLPPEKMENIKGYDQHADTMFAASFNR